MSKSRRTAYMEDGDDDAGSSIEGLEGTRVYACTEYDSPRAPPSRLQLANTSRSRRGDVSGSSSESVPRSAKKDKEDSKRAKEAKRQKEEDRERAERRRRSEEKKEAEARRLKAEQKVMKDSKALKQSSRPQLSRGPATQPVVQQAYRRPHDEPVYYGIPQPAASGHRPRANSRPASYYAGQTRAAPNPNWHQGPPPPSPYGPPPPPVGSYGAIYGGPPPMGMRGAPPPPSPSGLPASYYDPSVPSHSTQDLKKRFERPSSAMGHHNPSPRYYAEREEDMPHIPKRSTRQKEEDRMRMPPPQMRPMREMPRRPSTTANSTAPFQPPPMRPESRQGHSRPGHPHRRSVGFIDDDDDDNFFADTSPGMPIPQRRPSVGRQRRESVRYEDGDYDYIPSSGRMRRGSMLGAGALGAGGASLETDHRYLDAIQYQDDVSGPPMSLTAEALRKANKREERVPSSRSTRSSASRDESEYKRSSTTGITRSSYAGGDDFTIKISGPATVHVQGATIDVEDTELTFTNGANPRSGSDYASTQYLEDTHSQRKALPYRSRAPSQTDSHSRAYVPTHAPYDPPYL